MMALREVYNTARAFLLADPNNIQDWSSHGEVQVRRAFLAALTRIFDRLYYTPSPTVEAPALEDLSIVCRPLHLAADGYVFSDQFFRPRAMEWLERHEYSRSDGRGVNALHRVHLDRRWASSARRHADYADAGMVSEHLSYEFRLLERWSGFEDATAEELSGWVPRYASHLIIGWFSGADW